MQFKDILMVAGGAALLIQASVLGTLYASGFFTTAAETAAQTEKVVGVASIPLTPQPLFPSSQSLHSLSQAMYLCEDQLKSSDSQHPLSYQIHNVASRYLEQEGVYRIFFETQSTSRVDAPMRTAEVMCEVSANNMIVERFRSWEVK